VPRYIRVLPQEASIGKVFDYAVPEGFTDEALVRVGSEVRIDLHGRKLGGWVIADHVSPPPDVVVRPLAKVRGYGPPQEVVDLVVWAAWRWGGRPAHVMRFATPPRAIRRIGPPGRIPELPAQSTTNSTDKLADLAAAALRRGGVQLVRTPPSTDRFALILATIGAAGPAGTLIVTPSSANAVALARRLRRLAVPTALLPDDWAMAAAGGCVVVGARAAAFAPIPEPGAILVLDEHDEALQDERMPTWNARDVCIERARRRNIPCVLTSAMPSLEALAAADDLWALDRAAERSGWARVKVVDRTKDEPGRKGLLSSQLVDHLRTDDRILCILNRTGRARMLSCVACAALAVCEACGAAVHQPTDSPELSCPRCLAVRPIVCTSCGAGRMKNLRMGTSRAQTELEALALRRVGEVTGDTVELPDCAVLVGTEALLHRVDKATTVAFLDFDSELLAPRHRASEHALTLLARAARIVSGKAGVVIVQTHQPEHPVIQAAVLGDPGRLVEQDQLIRKSLNYPPFSALALLSGESAPEWATRLRAQPGVSVQGPADGRFLVRAELQETLSEALAEIDNTRPVGRVRIEMNPLRV
jgi:primosomal protein N' (replication factor Y) (superfamily II helicase)